MDTDADHKDKVGCTALSWPAGHKQVTIVTRLLDIVGVDRNATDYKGRTPLWFAAKSGADEVVSVLLRSGVQLDVRDDYRLTPFQIAAREGHEKIVTLLLDRMAALKDKHTADRTALYFAV